MKKKEEPFFSFTINNVSLCKSETANRFGRVVAFTERSRAHGVYQAKQRTLTKGRRIWGTKSAS